jgi:HK97 gp10 family phage protein
MARYFDVKVDITALARFVDKVDKAAMTSVRPAAQAGAQVFYDEVKQNVSRIGRKTGNLDASIYQVFSEDNSSDTKKTYHISWNARKAPHGHLVEYGHFQTRKAYIGSDGKWYTSNVLLATPRQVGARPFIRPAYDAKGADALQAVNDRWLADVEKAI